MRITAITAFILISNLCFGQTTIEKKFSDAFCSCLKIQKLISLTAKSLLDCSQSAVEKNSSLMMAEAKKKYGIASEENGYKFGQFLWNKVSVSLIFTCDSYYRLIDTTRYTAMIDLNKDSLIREIKTLDATGLESRNEDFYTQRGVLYFQLRDLDKALQDFDNAIKLNSVALQSIYFKAWALEIRKQYAEAILLYKSLVSLTKKNDFNIFAAIAERKKKGQ